MLGSIDCACVTWLLYFLKSANQLMVHGSRSIWVAGLESEHCFLICVEDLIPNKDGKAKN